MLLTTFLKISTIIHSYIFCKTQAWRPSE